MIPHGSGDIQVLIFSILDFWDQKFDILKFSFPNILASANSLSMKFGMAKFSLTVNPNILLKVSENTHLQKLHTSEIPTETIHPRN